MAKNLSRVQGRRGRQADLHGIKEVQHLTVFGQIVFDVAEADIAFAQFGVQRVTAVGFIDDDAIIHTRRGPFGRVVLIDYTRHQ